MRLLSLDLTHHYSCVNLVRRLLPHLTTCKVVLRFPYVAYLDAGLDVDPNAERLKCAVDDIRIPALLELLDDHKYSIEIISIEDVIFACDYPVLDDIGALLPNLREIDIGGTRGLSEAVFGSLPQSITTVSLSFFRPLSRPFDSSYCLDFMDQYPAEHADELNITVAVFFFSEQPPYYYGGLPLPHECEMSVAAREACETLKEVAVTLGIDFAYHCGPGITTRFDREMTSKYCGAAKK
jgi:hypothetical protein